MQYEDDTGIQLIFAVCNFVLTKVRWVYQEQVYSTIELINKNKAE